MNKNQETNIVKYDKYDKLAHNMVAFNKNLVIFAIGVFITILNIKTKKEKRVIQARKNIMGIILNEIDKTVIACY